MYVSSYQTARISGIFMFMQLYLQKVRHIKQLPVDMNAIKDGLSSLMVPSQKPMFSPHMYAVISVLFCSLLFHL
jgi:hypothetical protein